MFPLASILDQVHLDQEYRVIKQHILFARVVHWCYLTGLLPESSGNYPGFFFVVVVMLILLYR